MQNITAARLLPGFFGPAAGEWCAPVSLVQVFSLLPWLRFFAALVGFGVLERGHAEHILAAWCTEALKALSERHAKADLQARSLQAEGAKTSQREQLTTLRAPVSGTVQQRAVHIIGGGGTPAQGDLPLHALWHGARPGTTITADAVMKEPSLQPDKESKAIASGGAVFPATLTLAAHAIDVDGKAIWLAPGMNLAAEIKTGKCRLIEYLLSPVQSHVRESVRGR